MVTVTAVRVTLPTVAVRRDGDGFYYIVGRKKRFIKLYGNRVGLDEVERLLAARFPDTGFACVGRDDLLRIFHASPDPAVTGAAAEYLSEQMHFPERVFQIRALEAIPKNEAGKTQYRAQSTAMTHASWPCRSKLPIVK